MRNITGHWVDGDEFFGRESELGLLEESFSDKRSSVLIPGPRRIGKTSLVMEFIRRNKDKAHFIYFDLESRDSTIALCSDLIKELRKKHPDLAGRKQNLSGAWNVLSDMLPKLKIANIIEVETGAIKPEAGELIDQMEELFETLTHHDFVFAFDEFSDFLWNLEKKSHQEVVFFLKWLRRLRQENKIRLIISGSINIISTVEELNVADLVNDLSDLEIRPLKRTEIKELIEELIKEIDIALTDKAMEYVLERLDDGIPFFVQLFVSGLRSYREDAPEIYDLDKVEKIYEKITGKQHKEFIDLHSRLKDYLDEKEFKAAAKILAHLSSDPLTFDDLWPYVENLVGEKERLGRLLKRLTDECYLQKENSNYRFVSPMLADWWNSYYQWEK